MSNGHSRRLHGRTPGHNRTFRLAINLWSGPRGRELNSSLRCTIGSMPPEEPDHKTNPPEDFLDDEPVRIPITDIFDLHSVPPRDAKFILEALSRGSSQGRLDRHPYHPRSRNRSPARDGPQGSGPNAIRRRVYRRAARSRRMGSHGRDASRTCCGISHRCGITPTVRRP